jgi:hypothetical protein
MASLVVQHKARIAELEAVVSPLADSAAASRESEITKLQSELKVIRGEISRLMDGLAKGTDVSTQLAAACALQAQHTKRLVDLETEARIAAALAQSPVSPVGAMGLMPEAVSRKRVVPIENCTQDHFQKQTLAELERTVLWLGTKVVDDQKHLDAVEHQRRWVEFNVRDKLPLGHVWIQMDYASCYSSSGGKMNNLVLTLFSRDYPGGPLIEEYIDNFFLGKASWESTVGIFDFLLRKRPELFSRWTNFHISSDTGSGFRSTEWLYYLSTLEQKYNKTVEVDLFAPRHGYNMCDSHAGHIAKQVSIEKAAGTLLTPPICDPGGFHPRPHQGS